MDRRARLGALSFALRCYWFTFMRIVISFLLTVNPIDAILLVLMDVVQSTNGHPHS
jgi:uncharacterized membrane protein